MNIKTAVLSDTGNIRNINQDSLLVKIGEDKLGDFGLFAVADGMGGLAVGEIASHIAVSLLDNWWKESIQTIMFDNLAYIAREISNQLDYICDTINQKIVAYSLETGEQLGTTLTVLFVYGQQGIIKHIGDSRIYKVDKNNLEQLTHDDTWVAQQVNRGRISKIEAKNHPQGHILTKCLGMNTYEGVQSLNIKIEAKQAFLLCSDGTYNYIEEEQLRKYLHKINDRFTNSRPMLQKIQLAIQENNAPDNLSLIYIRLH